MLTKTIAAQEFIRPVYEKTVYVQECKYQGFAREGGQDTLQKKIE